MSKKMFYSAEKLVDSNSGEVCDIEMLDSDIFVEAILSNKGAGQDLVPASVKLPTRVIRCLENNSSILGVSKSELHRIALEIGLNEITRSYENHVSGSNSTQTVTE